MPRIAPILFIAALFMYPACWALPAKVITAVGISANAAQVQDPLPKPSVIDSTYVLKGDAIMGAETVHLYERDGRLIGDQKWARGGPDGLSDSVEYAKVNYVAVEPDSPMPTAQKTVVEVEASDGRFLTIPLRSEPEAKAVAEYVMGKTSLPLERIGDAWRVRKTFQCPEGVHPGCPTLKEMLDHDDPEIVEYFHSRDRALRTFGCFSDAAREFFVIRFRSYFAVGVRGWFGQEMFRDGQSSNTDIATIEWSGENFGWIRTDTPKPGQKPQPLGSIDPSSLAYRTTFPNRMDTTTQYELNIRWSTGRYTENYTGKDDKGNRFDTSSGGICVKLN